MRAVISPISKNVDRPYENLLPIVSLLLTNGNELATNGSIDESFYFTQGGWMCDLIQPIDFDLINKEFEFPESITIDQVDQSILDRKSWIIIRGNVG